MQFSVNSCDFVLGRNSLLFFLGLGDGRSPPASYARTDVCAPLLLFRELLFFLNGMAMGT